MLFCLISFSSEATDAASAEQQRHLIQLDATGAVCPWLSVHRTAKRSTQSPAIACITIIMHISYKFDDRPAKQRTSHPYHVRSVAIALLSSSILREGNNVAHVVHSALKRKLGRLGALSSDFCPMRLPTHQLWNPC